LLPYDFAEGLEYELESFIDEIIDENSKYLNENL
jgi:hypothetical protein